MIFEINLTLILQYYRFIFEKNNISGACGEMIKSKYDITQPKYKQCTVSVNT